MFAHAIASWTCVTVLLTPDVTQILAVPLKQFFTEPPGTAWTYSSPGNEFKITVPSSDWKKVNKRDYAAAFYNRKHSALATVSIVFGDDAKFRKRIVTLSDYFDQDVKNGKEVEKPTLVQSKTADDNPYAFWTMLSKIEGGGSAYLCVSVIHCTTSGLLVEVMMEAKLTMLSKKGQKLEREFVENAAKTLCLSLRSTERPRGK